MLVVIERAGLDRGKEKKVDYVETTASISDEEVGEFGVWRKVVAESVGVERHAGIRKRIEAIGDDGIQRVSTVPEPPFVAVSTAGSSYTGAFEIVFNEQSLVLATRHLQHVHVHP